MAFRKRQGTSNSKSRFSAIPTHTFLCHMYNTAIKHLFVMFTYDKLSQ